MVASCVYRAVPQTENLISVGGALAQCVVMVTDDEQSVPLISGREVGPLVMLFFFGKVKVIKCFY